MNLSTLQARQLELHEQSQSILALAEAEKRDPTPEERQELDELIAGMSTTKADIERMQALQGFGASLITSTRRSPAEPPNNQVGAEDDADPAPARMSGQQNTRIEFTERSSGGKWGWRSFGEFGQAVRAASMHGGVMDGRLAARMAPTTYGTEGTGSDGGFAVPPDFRSEIMQKVVGEDSLLTLTDQFTTSSNSITFPKDETTPWATSGGIQAYWEGEASQMTESKPALQQETIKLNKLTALVPVSDELLEDASALGTYLRRKVPEKMISKINYAIVQGDGVGKPLGILNAASKVQVGKETSQAADTLLPANVVKMYARMYGPLQSRAVWLVNQDVFPQIWLLAHTVKNVAGTENVGGAGVNFMSPTGLQGSPYATLLGRPVIPTQACETIGDAGDIIFVDLGSYLTATKTAGPRADTSIHLYFDYNVTAFRFIWRMAGKPWWSEDIDPRDGSNALSWAVTLEAR